MSSISVLQAPGPGQVASVKPSSNASPPALSTEIAGTASTVADPVTQYTTPRFEIDPETDRVILEYRDAQSGEPQYQVPSRAQLLAYQDSQAAQTPAAPASSSTSTTAA
jgi:hypothetical protein